jgi:golgi phosphoprotein 3
MAAPKSLFLYEEIMLLALRNEKGTLVTGFVEYAVAGAVLAEWLLDGRITIEDARRHLVDVRNARPLGDPVLDECLERMLSAGRRGSLQTWVSRLAGIKDLRHKVARQLCERRILRAEEDKVLLLFTRRVYPEINPVPEKQIVERLRRAIFTDVDPVDPRTVVLVSLAHGAGLLNEAFGGRNVRGRRKRIDQMVKGELAGRATREVIVACQTAVMVATMVPALVASTSS